VWGAEGEGGRVWRSWAIAEGEAEKGEGGWTRGTGVGVLVKRRGRVERVGGEKQPTVFRCGTERYFWTKGGKGGVGGGGGERAVWGRRERVSIRLRLQGVWSAWGGMGFFT